MERLTGMDATLLYMETPTAHMHTIKVAIFDGVNSQDGFLFDEAKKQMAKRLDNLLPLRRRMINVPFGLHHPVWIEDPDFDLNYHVRRVCVPTPGGQQEMDDVVSRVASQPLDRSRPLWEVWFMEGLEGGRIGAVAKVHHAVADGVAAAALLVRALSYPSDDTSEPWTSEPVPTPLSLIGNALTDRLYQTLHFPALLLSSIWRMLVATRRHRHAVLQPPRPGRDTPKVKFCAALTPQRVFVSTTLLLADFKEVKSVFGVKVNDVVLATVAAAVRRYLKVRDALPERPLVAEVPISTDPPGGQPRLAGNHVSSMATSLCTDLEEPVERLLAIHEVTSIAKEFHHDSGLTTIEDWLEYMPPRLFAWVMRQYSRSRLADRLPPRYNVIVSSVGGPKKELAWKGAPLRSLYSVGPILEGVGFNVTMWSYEDRVCVGSIACDNNLPELREIIDGLHTALDELLVAARHRAESIKSGDVVE